ncbi:MAG TPA: sulfite exporter TauE/SafE family protein [Polyangiaceae bacterium]|nr:sulfite exporter TauE/SafE family protein [Polyangiaceae bacterium]
MTPDLWLPVGAALVAGALNAVAGGGSFFTFPSLVVFAGLGSIEANATSTVALWPASAAGALAYRRDIGLDRGGLVASSAASLVGGALGAILLLRTPTRVFDGLVPFLVLVATAVFTFGGPLTRRLRARRPDGAEAGGPSPLAVTLVQLAIGVYGGYFGGGIGFMMLAAFVLLGQRDLNAMNAQKNLFALLMNGAAVVTFVASGAIVWRAALPMAVAATAGGYAGAAAARRVDARYVRPAVAAVGWAITAYFFYRAYGR